MRAINVSGKITKIETPEYGRRIASERQILKYDLLHMPKISANDYMFVRVRACSADVPNRNGDCFPYDELKAAYPTFIGCGVYTNHEADCVENMKGIILDAVFKEDTSHGAWVELLLAVSRYNEDLCHKIATGQITDVSMGCIVREGICSVCGNICRGAKDEYGRVIDSCQHLERKGADWNGERVFEKCGGVEFIEISFVTDGADPEALVLDNNIVPFEQLPEHVSAKVFESEPTKRAASATKRSQLANTLVCELNSAQAEHIFELCRHASPELYWDTYHNIQQYPLSRAIRFLKDMTHKRSTALDEMINSRQMFASFDYVLTEEDVPDLRLLAQEYGQVYTTTESDSGNAENMQSYVLGKYEESLNEMNAGDPVVVSDPNGIAAKICNDVVSDLLVQVALRTQPLSRKAAFKRIKNLADLTSNQTVLVTDSEYGLRNTPASVHNTLRISKLSKSRIDWVEVFIDQHGALKLAKLYQDDVDSGVTILHSV